MVRRLLAQPRAHDRPTEQLASHLEVICRVSGVDHHRAFTDTLTAIRCALARPLMEDEYLEVAARHVTGGEGSWGIDRMAAFMADLTRHDEDVLGELYQATIGNDEAGQFWTPEHVCQLMATMSLPPVPVPESKTVCDPCCGSGRTLLAAARLQPHWHFVGRDIDFRCVQMTAINLGLRNLYGHVIWGDTLAGEVRRVFQTGRLLSHGNVVREISIENIPESVRQFAEQPAPPTGGSQLTLFDEI